MRMYQIGLTSQALRNLLLSKVWGGRTFYRNPNTSEARFNSHLIQSDFDYNIPISFFEESVDYTYFVVTLGLKLIVFIFIYDVFRRYAILGYENFEEPFPFWMF